jgi:FkbM family methyltransferase
VILRRIVERLSRQIVLRRALPAALGGRSIYVTPDASLRFWRTSLDNSDPDLFRLCKELIRPGDVVWDVGANVGLFSFAAAFRAGPTGEVLAIEADPFLATVLQRSSREFLPNDAPVDVLHAAITSTEGPTELAIAARGRAANHLATVDGSSQSGGFRAIVRVPGRTLDGLLHQRRPPRVLKIDVEGAEHLCLQSARNLLSSARPVILCEVSSQNAAVVQQLLHSFDYTLFDASKPEPARIAVQQPCWNTLAIPYS